MAITRQPVGELIRGWRERRRRTQMDVSIAADLSPRHLSFIETGRAAPSAAMVERLCEELEVPLRERNSLFLAAGYAPAYAERPPDDLGIARSAIDAVLTGHEPNPALAVNVRWELLAANRPMEALLGGVADELLTPPVNVLRATLHPHGLASQVRNYEQWRAQALRRVRRQLERTAADGLAELLDEIESYPAPTGADAVANWIPDNDLVSPMVISSEHGDLSFHYALTVFGAARDVTLDEIAIETFFPADDATASALQNGFRD